MLILAAVTINIVINGGLIGYARNAREAQESEQEKEKEEMLKAEYEMAKLTGGTEAKSYSEYILEKTYGAKIGDTFLDYNCLTGETLKYVATDVETGVATDMGEGQTFEVTQNPEWKIIGIEDGKLLITTSEPIADTLSLGGQEGYVNGVDVLNKVAALYGHGEHADTTKYTYSSGKSAGRSITMEDIENITGFSKEKNYNSNFDSYYGLKSKYKKVTTGNEGEYKIQCSTDGGQNWYDLVEDMGAYDSDFTYYNKDKKEWITLSVEGENNTAELTDTGYSYGALPQLLSGNTRALLITNEQGAVGSLKYKCDNFWIARRSETRQNINDRFQFCMQALDMRGKVTPVALFSSQGHLPDVITFGVRPVVCLSAEIELVGSSEAGWSIK